MPTIRLPACRGLRSLACAVAALALLQGCGPKVLDYRNSEISNGKIYAGGANEPFSGKVTNVPAMKLPMNGLRPMLTVISASTGDQAYANWLTANALARMLGGTTDTGVLCDVQADKGLLEGAVECTAEQSPLLKVAYSASALHGKATVHDPRNKGALVAETTFDKERMEGELKVYDARSGKLIRRASFKQGVANGLEEGWDTAGALIFKGNIVNGLYDGEVFRVVKGQQEKLLFRNGVPQAAAQPAPAVNNCLDQWGAAYRKEAGEDAMVKADQIAEWEGWCREGKLPPQ